MLTYSITISSSDRVERRSTLVLFFHWVSSPAEGCLQNPYLCHPAVVLHLLMSLVRDWIPGSEKTVPNYQIPLLCY